MLRANFYKIEPLMGDCDLVADFQIHQEEVIVAPIRSDLFYGEEIQVNGGSLLNGRTYT